MARRRTRRHCGGSNGIPKYKYIHYAPRAKWTNSLYPYANTILSALSKLHWSEFHYEGPTTFQMEVLPNENTSDGFTISTESKQQTKVVSSVLTANPNPYEIFGGAACELYNSAFPQVSIYQFVDPTGDIDIRVSQPIFTLNNDPELQSYYDESGHLEILMIQDGTYTECGNAFTQWIFEEVVEKLEPIADQFIRKEFSLPRIDEDEETILSDLQENVGNFLITRFITEDKEMIKIQVTIKVGNHVNHLVEFIVFYKGFKSSKNNLLIKGLYVQQPRTVLQSQLDTLVSRGKDIPQMNHFETHLNFYKIENHCGRILYLIHLLKEIGLTRYKNVNIDTLSVSDAILILKKLYTNNIYKLCSKHFGETYMDQIIQVLESFSSIRKGTLTTMLNPVYKKQLNKAKGLLGGRKTCRHSLKRRVSCKSKSTFK